MWLWPSGAGGCPLSIPVGSIPTGHPMCTWEGSSSNGRALNFGCTGSRFDPGPARRCGMDQLADRPAPRLGRTWWPAASPATTGRAIVRRKKRAWCWPDHLVRSAFMPGIDCWPATPGTGTSTSSLNARVAQTDESGFFLKTRPQVRLRPRAPPTRCLTDKAVLF